MFKIDNNIPIPSKPLEGATDFFKTLEVGQSFLVPNDSRNSMHQIAKRTGIRIRIKADGEQSRVWRVE